MQGARAGVALAGTCSLPGHPAANCASAACLSQCLCPPPLVCHCASALGPRPASGARCLVPPIPGGEHHPYCSPQNTNQILPEQPHGQPPPLLLQTDHDRCPQPSWCNRLETFCCKASTSLDDTPHTSQKHWPVSPAGTGSGTQTEHCPALAPPAGLP